MDTISGIYTTAQEAIGASWAAATAEEAGTNTHVGQRVPQRERFPPNSLHRLLPAEWGQGKRTGAINRYKKDLCQAEEELQQLHFNEQPGGLHDTGIKAKADPSTKDDYVWEYLADIINSGDYRTEPNARQRRPAFRLRPAGDEHSSHSDEELLDSLTNAYFKPVKCSEEEDSGDPEPHVPERSVRMPPSPLTFLSLIHI